MRLVSFLAIVFVISSTISCGSGVANSTARSSPTMSAATATPVPSPPAHPKNGDYPAKGKVTKINNELGSVEVDHEDVPGLMPPMIMEFYVDDRSVLKQIAVGDRVDFVIRYKDGQETISKISRAK